MDEEHTLRDPVAELITRTERVSCADNRLELTPLQSPTNTPNLSLVGKICSPRNFFSLVVRDIVTKAWNPSHAVHVQKVDRNVFVFSFEHETDMHLAFNRRPWTLRGAHLILKQWNPLLTWQEMEFNTSCFWVQVHGLPAFWQCKENLTKIGNLLGETREVDLSGDPKFHCHRFVRVRVELTITNPLSPGFFLPRPGLCDTWIGLKYEKLPELCYICGVIGHDVKSCNLERSEITNEYGYRFPAFGRWLRTDNVEFPPGVYTKIQTTPDVSLESFNPVEGQLGQNQPCYPNINLRGGVI